MKKLAERFFIYLFASAIVIFSAVNISAAACGGCGCGSGCDAWNWNGQGHWEYQRIPTTLDGCEADLANCEYDYTDHGIFFYIVKKVWVYDTGWVDGLLGGAN